ncbi:MAG: hypothetical protein HY608_09915 [Planctomycetes bacterium]|nr:hypothetical protein [Planctomycetota bacterium]
MKTGWLIAGLGLVAAVAVAGTVVSLGEIRALRRDLDAVRGTVSTQRQTQATHRQSIESLRRHQPQLTAEEFAAWKEEIDRVTRESFGALVELNDENGSIAAIIESVRADVEDVESLRTPEIQERLQQEVRQHVALALEEKGLILKRQRPSVADLAGSLSLDDMQALQMREAFARARDRTLAMMQEPRDDGTDLLAEFVDLENVSVYDPERDARYWKLLRLPSAGTTVHQRMLLIEDETDLDIQRILTASQYEVYKALDIIPGELTLGGTAGE